MRKLGPLCLVIALAGCAANESIPPGQTSSPGSVAAPVAGLSAAGAEDPSARRAEKPVTAPSPPVPPKG